MTLTHDYDELIKKLVVDSPSTVTVPVNCYIDNIKADFKRTTGINLIKRK